jgi:hypothetical protein
MKKNWLRRYFHKQVNQLVSSQISKNSSIIDIGSSDGLLLRACLPSRGVGIEQDSIFEKPSASHESHLEFIYEAVENIPESPLITPDYIVLSLVLDQVADISTVLEKVKDWSTQSTRVVVVTYNRIWRPFIWIAEAFKIKPASTSENYVPYAQVVNLLELSGFEVTRSRDGILLPILVPWFSTFVNRWMAPLPILRHLCLVKVTTARKISREIRPPESVSIVVAARNEEGNIDEIIRRLPQLANYQELIFVEGGSSDATWETIQRAVRNFGLNSSQKIIALQQTGQGKGDAVRCGFEAASGELLMILDADLSVAPEELYKFVDAISSDSCEFANGSRMVYPMDKYAMRFLNILGNKFFAQLFQYLIGQPIGDTLCGTKVLRNADYQKIIMNRHELGDFDPFGDFDLLFGASKIGLKIRDIPVHYKERTYGETNISRFSHGLLLIKMCRVAAVKLKFTN